MFDLKPKSLLDFDTHCFPFSQNPRTGDHASLNQAAECIRLLDVDGDGRIGLWDYVNFAAR